MVVKASQIGLAKLPYFSTEHGSEQLRYKIIQPVQLEMNESLEVS